MLIKFTLLYPKFYRRGAGGELLVHKYSELIRPSFLHFLIVSSRWSVWSPPDFDVYAPVWKWRPATSLLCNFSKMWNSVPNLKPCCLHLFKMLWTHASYFVTEHEDVAWIYTALMIEARTVIMVISIAACKYIILISPRMLYFSIWLGDYILRLLLYIGTQTCCWPEFRLAQQCCVEYFISVWKIGSSRAKTKITFWCFELACWAVKLCEFELQQFWGFAKFKLLEGLLHLDIIYSYYILYGVCWETTDCRLRACHLPCAAFLSATAGVTCRNYPRYSVLQSLRTLTYRIVWRQ